MSKITAKSPTVEKTLALIKVRSAMLALRMVQDIGLDTGAMQESQKQLNVFEGQLLTYLKNESIN